MASVINSARGSTASVFDLIGNIANAGNALVDNGVLAIDALSSKTRRMHASVIGDEIIGKVQDRRKLIDNAASDYADHLETLHRRRFSDQPFDWNSAYMTHHAELTAAFTEASK